MCVEVWDRATTTIERRKKKEKERKQRHTITHFEFRRTNDCLMAAKIQYSTVGCRRTGGKRSQPGSFLFFTTSANIVVIFQSDFESRIRRLACSAHTVGLRDDACRAGNAAEIFQNVGVQSFRSQQCRCRSRLHSKRCLCVVKPLLTHFSSLGSFLF